MGVIVNQNPKREGPIDGPRTVAASEIGPTTYGVGAPRQERWEDYQPEVAEEMKRVGEMAEAAQPATVDVEDVSPKADGGHVLVAPRGRSLPVSARAEGVAARESAASEDAGDDESADQAVRSKATRKKK